MNKNVIRIALQLLVLISTSTSFADLSFPQGPDATMTPGSVCTHPDAYRYAEHIPYCNRNVSSDRKRQIIDDYDKKFNYNIETDRQDFKIDHYIPLCMGGSNDDTNLWPQHKSIYAVTDPVEPLACQKMADGKLLQKRAIELIQQAKNHLEQVPQVMAILQAL